MSEIKNKIKKNLIDNNIYNNSIMLIEGKIIKSNEEANSCKVQYINKFGSSSSADAEVSLANTGFADWFPKINDTVIILLLEDKPVIVGPKFKNKRNNKLENKKDILSDFFVNGIGGELF